MKKIYFHKKNSPYKLQVDHSRRLRKEFFQTTSPNPLSVGPLLIYWSAPKLIVQVALLIHDTQMVRYD